MGHDATSWKRQKGLWAELKALHASSIDLDRVALLRDASREALATPGFVEQLLLQLGLNDEAIAEFPHELQPWCGQGLRIWQYPKQFGKYLVQLSQLAIRSYVEIGIRHGGSFVATTEYLERFHPLDYAIGVDIIPCPSMASYEAQNPKAAFWCANVRSPDFIARLEGLGAIDLVFIDSHHEEEQCRTELDILRERASMIAFHDIANIGCPGIQRVWQDLSRSTEYACFEYVEQYGDLGPFMGIGLAIRKERLR